MKLQDIDMVKESVQVQELTDNLRNIINQGGFEFEVTTAATPGTAPQETKIVLSIFGATYRLYISYLGSWYYTTLTKV